MGYPLGWVAGLLPHGPALRACGNGVVPQQAIEALRRLMGIEASLNPSGESITVILDPQPNL